MKNLSSLSDLIKKANKSVADNKLLDALNIYRKICNISDANPEAWMALGSVAGNLGRFSEAESAFKRAVALLPKDLKSVLLLSQAQEAMGKNSEALSTLIPHLKSENKIPELTIRAAFLYGKNELYHESITYLNEYIKYNKNNPDAYHYLAAAYGALDDFDNANANYMLAIQLAPKSFDLHHKYGVFLHTHGLWEKALKEYKTALEYKKDNPSILYNIAVLNHALGYYHNAVEHYNNAIRLKSNFIEALIGLAKSHRSLSNIDTAIDIYNQVLSINPDNFEAIANKGLAYTNIAKFDTAIEYLQKALDLNPDNIEVICELSLVYERRGEISKAIDLIRPLLDTNSTHHKVVSAYGVLCRNINEQKNAIQLLENTAQDTTLPYPVKAEIHFLLGKLLNSEKKYDAAFEHYKLANSMQPNTHNSEGMRISAETRIKSYNKSTLSQLPQATPSEAAPVFIVGMPRSGTTLIEQIISSHSEVYGAGELGYLNEVSAPLQKVIMNASHDKNVFNKIDEKYVEELADQYINLSQKGADGKKYITDKMPHNFQLLGIIQLLFPNARVIHSIRNPVDNCLSIYFSNLNTLHPYSGRLEDTAEYYTEYYMKIMNHWKQVLDMDILDIEYEELVNNQTEVSKKIIDHCGLAWEDDCFNYHKTGRNVATISYDQVRQPIYKTSINRWRNYSKHIEPLLDYFN